MNEHRNKYPWLPDLLEKVREELTRLNASDDDLRPGWEQERDRLQANSNGWSASLGNPNLPSMLRREIEQQFATALNRIQEIDYFLGQQEAQQESVEETVNVDVVLARLESLADVLANHNPTLGNLELSLHIDRIECGPERTVSMRTCKLGGLTGAVELLSESDIENGSKNQAATDKQATSRRRGRPSLGDADDQRGELRALSEFAVDPDRFAGLGDEWFWTDEFRIPEKPPSWAEKNGEAVFRRRQEARLSYAKLGKEFDVTPPTARAAVRDYLAKHPDEKDEVNLPRGGQRPPKFDLSEFGHEARALWEAGRSKLQLAKQYGCSSPTIDKALSWSYEQEGLRIPTRQDRKDVNIQHARKLYDDGLSLKEIAQSIGNSDVTVRGYLRESFAREGKRMPDGRRRHDQL